MEFKDLREDIINAAVEGVKSYIEVFEAYEKPTTEDERVKFFNYLIESPADWTGYYEPETTFDGIRWEDIDCLNYDFIKASVAFARSTGNYRNDEPWVTEIMSAVRLYIGWTNFEAIVNQAYREMENSIRNNRLIKMLEIWRGEEEGEKTKEYKLLDDLINLLEDPTYLEDRLKEYDI